MSAAIDKLFDEASELDVDQRAHLALRLIESLEPREPADEVERAWNLLAMERLAAYDNGLIETVPAEELHASIAADLRKRNR